MKIQQCYPSFLRLHFRFYSLLQIFASTSSLVLTKSLVNTQSFHHFPYYIFIEAKGEFDEPFIWIHLFFSIRLAKTNIWFNSFYVCLDSTKSFFHFNIFIFYYLRGIIKWYHFFSIPIIDCLEHCVKVLLCWYARHFRTWFHLSIFRNAKLYG